MKFDFDKPVSNEERLSTPLEYHVLALRNISKLDLDLSHGQNVSRCRQAHDKGVNKAGG